MATSRARRPSSPPQPTHQNQPRRRKPVRSGATVDRPEYAPFRVPKEEHELVDQYHHHKDRLLRDDALNWAILYNEAMREVAAWKERTCQQLTEFLRNPYDATTGRYVAPPRRLEQYPFLVLCPSSAVAFSIEAPHREFPNEKDRAYAQYALSDRDGIVVSYYGIEHFCSLPSTLRFPTDTAQHHLRDHLKTVVVFLSNLLPPIPEPAPRRVISL
jgi:hypothetical protein